MSVTTPGENAKFFALIVTVCVADAGGMAINAESAAMHAAAITCLICLVQQELLVLQTT